LGYVLDHGFGSFLPKTLPDVYMNNRHFHLLCWLSAAAGTPEFAAGVAGCHTSS
jgi:hypothetical protein